MDAIWILRGRWFGGVGGFLNFFFFTLHNFFSFFFQAQRCLRLALPHYFRPAGKKPIWGLLSPCPAVKAYLRAPCWRSAVLVVTRETGCCCCWAAGLAGHTDRRGEQGRREITCLILQTKWISRQCQSVFWSKRSNRLWFYHRRRLTPVLSDLCLL